MLLALVLLPLLAGAAAFFWPSRRTRPLLLPLVGAAHLGLVAAVLRTGPGPAFRGWLVLDPLGSLVLLLVSGLFLLCAVYAVGYLRHHDAKPNRVFCACLLAFLSAMTLVTLAHHLGLMWVAVEATTLTSAPLIYFRRGGKPLEAVWKYLVICSVGIALALLGSFFLAYASLHGGLSSSLLFDDLLRTAPKLSLPWVQAAFVLLLVGYGTKMGLAPMHTWKPDAYGEAPGVVGALFAGGMTACAFLAILRIYHLCHAAGDAAYARQILLAMGLLSMGVAAVFLVRQRDYKRMLAWSSVEHMGILALGLGIGTRPALFGVLLHLFNNGLTKGVLFLSAGNLHRAYGSKNVDHVTGAMRAMPLSGAMFLLGFLAITGSPPFGPFFSEFTILGATFGSGHFGVGALFLGLLLVVFFGMGTTALPVVQGRAPAPAALRCRDDLWTGLPMLALLGAVLLLGLYLPPPFRAALDDAVAFLEGRP